MISKWYLRAAGLMIATALLWGCETHPTDPSNVQDDLTTKAAQTSSEVVNTVATVQKIGEFLGGADDLIAVQSPDLNNPGSGGGKAMAIKQQVLNWFEADQRAQAHLLGAASDSLIWELTVRNQEKGYTETARLYYDFETGKGRVEDIKFKFDDRHKVKRDSVVVIVDLNKTLEDESDDVIESLEELKLYKENQPIVQEWAKLVLDPYTPGTEPQGAVYDKRITNADNSFVLETIEHAEIHNGNSGELSKVVKYSDGTESSEKVTFSADGTGTYEATGRFGKHVEGTFDSPDDDGVGAFTLTTTFPEGSDPKSIYEAGNFTIDPSDSTLHGTFEKRITFKNGDVISETVKLDESYENGNKVTRLEVTKSDGSGGVLVVEEGIDTQKVTGEWTDADGTYTRFTVDYYP
ncbi:MAG: hypothetical protein D6743_04550, partial [Calditrichaeota bacterium]